MARKAEIGEFEQIVLLAALRLGKDAYAPGIARVLEERARREVARGTLYAALERLEERGFIEWRIEAATSRRSGSRRRMFQVTPEGIRALSASRSVLVGLWDGVEHLLKEDEA